MRKLLIALVLLSSLLGLAFWNRHTLIVAAVRASGPPELLEPNDEGPGTRWVDDYFTVKAIDPHTFAIGEPRYYQQNYSYLILGETRALLFDAGPGVRDIRSVVDSLTDLPVTFLPSHFHYDHVGNTVVFDRVAVVDLPYLRRRAPDGRLLLLGSEHMGFAEAFDAPTLVVDDWVAPGESIDLGGRMLRVLHTPGHSLDSISLLDASSGQAFSGDFVIPGPLFAFLPNSGMGDYLMGAENVLAAAPTHTRIYAAHRMAPPGVPEVGLGDVADLRDALVEIREGVRDGSGAYPVIYPVNERIELWADPAWLQRWEPSPLGD